jgi:hypothetical protein
VSPVYPALRVEAKHRFPPLQNNVYITCTFTDTGAIPTSSNGDAHPPPVSRTVEYHRPTRNSAHYTLGTDMSLGMVSATSSPRLGGGAPTSFKSPPIQTPNSFDTSSHMLPSRAAPAPPGLMRRDSNQTPHSQQTLGAGPSRPYPKSTSNSPNPNRYSAGASSTPLPPMSNGTNGPHGIPPPRPTRAGTMPYADSGQNGLQPMSATQGLARGNPSVLSPAPGSNFLAQPAPPTLPPLHHQPYSSPNNPYSTQGIEKGIEDTKLGQGMGMPMNVVEPTKEKELPNAPNAATRSRSGTGKSQKGKSIFGLSFSGMVLAFLLVIR